MFCWKINSCYLHACKENFRNTERVDSEDIQAWGHLIPYNTTNSSDSYLRIIRKTLTNQISNRRSSFSFTLGKIFSNYVVSLRVKN